MAENKVRYGLKNIHLAVIEEEVDGTEVYGEVQRVRGAVSLSLSPLGEMNNFHADDSVYYTFASNSGYEGSLELAEIPQFFTEEILGEELVDGVLVESVHQRNKRFAMMFEFDGDKKATRYVLYNCTASRPEVSGETTTEAIEAQTSELSFTASPNLNGQVRAKTTMGANEETYANWYKAPFNPNVDQEELSTFTNKIQVEK